MTKYAKINSDNIVENIIICEDSEIYLFSGNYIKESIDTKEANIGDFWDKDNNKFISPKPFESWSLDESFEWKAPIEKLVPNSYWSEENLSWIVTDITTEE